MNLFYKKYDISLNGSNKKNTRVNYRKKIITTEKELMPLAIFINFRTTLFEQSERKML